MEESSFSPSDFDFSMESYTTVAPALIFPDLASERLALLRDIEDLLKEMKESGVVPSDEQARILRRISKGGSALVEIREELLKQKRKQKRSTLP